MDCERVFVGEKMNVSGISFGNKKQVTPNFNNQRDKAIAELWNYYQQTKDFRPAKIDFYKDGRTKISLIGTPPKTSQNSAQAEGLTSNVKQFVTVAQSQSKQSLFAKTKNFIKKLFRRI